jgi:hypothetical protein
MFHVDLYAAESTMDGRLADERRHVENRRLASRVKEGCRSSRRLHCRLLLWLGHHLVAWGTGLQQRYSVAAGSPASRPARHAAG